MVSLVAEEVYEGESLDLEWLELMVNARNIGLSVEEVRHFLNTEFTILGE